MIVWDRFGFRKFSFTRSALDYSATGPLKLSCLLDSCALTFLSFQLGPVLQSPFAKEYGLEISFLERLTRNLFYQRDPVKFVDHGCYDPLLATKLIRNYRLDLFT